MRENVVSITLWGNTEKFGKWKEWYIDVKGLMESLGYEVTHLGVIGKTYHPKKIVTVKRKEKELLAKMKEGEEFLSLELESLPKDFNSAYFDCNVYCSRNMNFNYIDFFINESSYNQENEEKILKVIKKYIDYDSGEIYYSSRADLGCLYAYQRDSSMMKSYKLIKTI